MTVLAIETATGSVGVGLAGEGGLIGSLQVQAGRRHAELLHSAVAALLGASGISFGDLRAVAVDVGPGLFTGVRVGVSAAKGFAMALGVPLVGRTSLEILHLGCEAAGCPRSLGVVDLRRGEVAWSPLARPPGARGGAGPAAGGLGGLRHGPPTRLAAELAEWLEADQELAEPVVLAGDGAARYGELLTAGLGGRARLAGPELTAPPVATLALVAAAAGGGADPSEVMPVYLRPADVRISWTTRHDAPGRRMEAG